MKIGVDYRLANTSHRGMARYCREIVKLLIRNYQHEYVLFVDEQPSHPFIQSNTKYHIIKSKNYIIGEQLCLPKAIKSEKCDIFWSPNNTFPISLDKSVKLLVTIHDVIFFYKSNDPQSLHQLIGKYYRRLILKLFSNKISHCFTVSNYSKHEINKILKLTIPIDVTYNCIDSFRENVNIYKQQNDVKSGNYFFTVSGDAPSKNLLMLIGIFQKEFPNETLIIAGLKKDSPMRKYESSRIHFLDEGISDRKLIKRYLECKCFLFCSKYEGFGVPIIEAAICEKPIIATNTTSIPEILLDKGLLVYPDENCIIDGIRGFLNGDINISTNYNSILERFNSWSIPANIISSSFIKNSSDNG